MRPESKAYAYKWLSHDPSTANRPRPLYHAMTNQETFSYESDNGRTRFEVKVHTMKNEEGIIIVGKKRTHLSGDEEDSPKR